MGVGTCSQILGWSEFAHLTLKLSSPHLIHVLSWGACSWRHLTVNISTH